MSNSSTNNDDKSQGKDTNENNEDDPNQSTSYAPESNTNGNNNRSYTTADNVIIEEPISEPSIELIHHENFSVHEISVSEETAIMIEPENVVVIVDSNRDKQTTEVTLIEIKPSTHEDEESIINVDTVSNELAVGPSTHLTNFAVGPSTHMADLAIGPASEEIIETDLVIVTVPNKNHDFERELPKIDTPRGSNRQKDIVIDIKPNKEDILIDIGPQKSKKGVDIDIIKGSLWSGNIGWRKKFWTYKLLTKHLWQQERFGSHQRPPLTLGETAQDKWTQAADGRGFGGGFVRDEDGFGTPLVYDPKTRNSFIRLVMLIVFIMLMATACILLFVLSSIELRIACMRHFLSLLLLSITVLMGVNYAFICSPCARKLPINVILLVLTVMGMSTLAAIVSARYRTEIVLQAAFATAFIVLVCLGLACTSFDFTKFLLYVVVIAAAFTVITLIVFIYMIVLEHYIKPLHMIILVASVLLQSVILVLTLQMILGGKTVELSEDDYALAAYMLYTSIVDIFIKMVQILGMSD